MYTRPALSEQQVQDIHERSLYFIEKHGVMLKHQGCRDIMAKNGALVEGEIVKVPAAIMEKLLKDLPSRFTVTARDRSKSVEIGRGLPYVSAPTTSNVFITEGDTKRKATMDDWQNALKLAHTSDVCDLICPYIMEPESDDITAMVINQYYQGVSMTDKPLNTVSFNPKIAEASLNFAKIAVDAAPDQYYCVGGANTNSPLIWDEYMAASIYLHAHAKQPMFLASCAMAGFTTHIKIAETLLITNIELIFGIALIQMISPGLPCIYGNVSGASDMKSMNLTMCSPDTLLIAGGASQLARYYNLPVRISGSLTDAKMLDAQAGMEAALTLLIGMLNDVSFAIHGFGMMEGFGSISLEKWMLDEENTRWCRHYLYKKIDDIQDNIYDVMLKAGYGGNYLYDDSTMTLFRTAFFEPQLTDRLVYGAWKERNLTIEQKAKEMWQKRVAEYQAPAIDSTVQQALAKYYQSL